MTSLPMQGKTVVNGTGLLYPHLVRAVPGYRVVILVQRFLLLDADRLRTDRLRWLGEVFLQAFVALAIYLVTNCLPYLH